MNNTTKFKTGSIVKVTFKDTTEKAELETYYVKGMLTNAFPMGYSGAIAGLYIRDYFLRKPFCLGDIMNIYPNDEINLAEEN
ncbi:MAG: hypothetical protein HYY40_01470 [Bacteroidetes bacterium]|nr:hypothetical protein [Bacteroidota bacterium]